MGYFFNQLVAHFYFTRFCMNRQALNPADGKITSLIPKYPALLYFLFILPNRFCWFVLLTRHIIKIETEQEHIALLAMSIIWLVIGWVVLGVCCVDAGTGYPTTPGL